MTATETRLQWVMENVAGDFIRSACGRYDAFWSHQDRAWVCYDTRRPAKSPYGDLTEVKEWAETRSLLYPVKGD